MLQATWQQKKQVNGTRRIKSKGQVMLETTIAFAAVVIFLLGITQIFLWMNRSIIERQKAYQASRTSLGSGGAENFYSTQLRVFPEEH